MFVCSEAVVAQVLDELGLQLTDQLSGNFLPVDQLLFFLNPLSSCGLFSGHKMFDFSPKRPVNWPSQV